MDVLLISYIVASYIINLLLLKFNLYGLDREVPEELIFGGVILGFSPIMLPAMTIPLGICALVYHILPDKKK